MQRRQKIGFGAAIRSRSRDHQYPSRKDPVALKSSLVIKNSSLY